MTDDRDDTEIPNSIINIMVHELVLVCVYQIDYFVVMALVVNVL